MSWPCALAGSVSPIGAASSDIVTYILGYGPIGIALVLIGLLAYRGWSLLVSPAQKDKIRAESRADLEQQITRLIEDRAQRTAERDKAQADLAELQGYIRDQFGPLIANFTTATQALLPVLQQRVSDREREGRRASGRRPAE